MTAPPPDPALVAAGHDDRVAALHATALDELGDRPVRLGRVVRVDYGRATVLTGAGVVGAAAHELPAVGDWVLVDDGTDPPTVATVLPRWSALVRHAAGERAEGQVVAADVDLVLCVHGLDRLPVNANRVEREQVLAWDAGARPLVLLTKADVPSAEEVDAEVAALEGRILGVDLLVVSVRTGVGLDELAARLRPSRTAVLLGASGVGKSSVVNALVGEELQATGDVRTRDRKGRHTTTVRQLVPVPGGGVLLDTPGVRSLGVWVGGEGIEQVFGDVEELAASCRFSDCAHAGEPGCAVAAAVAEGRLDADRVDSWRKLAAEQARLERRLDARAGAEERRRWRTMSKAMRDLPPKR